MKHKSSGKSGYAQRKPVYDNPRKPKDVVPTVSPAPKVMQTNRKYDGVRNSSHRGGY